MTDIATDPNFNHWRDNLAGKKPLISADAPQPGFYSERRRGEVDRPVAIYFEDDELIAVAGFETDASPLHPSLVWTRVCDRPISEELYYAAIDGGAWPSAPSADVLPREAAIGDNDPPADKAEEIKSFLDAAAKRAAELTIATDDDEAKAQGLRSRILELVGEADAYHGTEKEPHLTAGRAVDERWRFRAIGKEWADALRKKIANYNDAKREKARREQAAREAEQRRLEEEARKNNAPPPPPPPEPEPEPTQVKPVYGRAASKKAIIIVDKIADIGALAKHFERDAKLVERLIQLANQQLKVGVMPPGVTTKETTDVR